jgi:hypothetical protein
LITGRVNHWHIEGARADRTTEAPWKAYLLINIFRRFLFIF